MPTQRLEVVQASIVMVYEAIDRVLISRDHLQKLITGQRPRLVDLPGGPLILDYPEVPGIGCLINERRIYLNQAGPTEPGEGKLADMALTAARAVVGATMVGYGDNFHVKGSIDSIGDIGHFLRDSLLRGVDQLQVALGGSIACLSPRLKYPVGNAMYELQIEPDDAESTVFRARLNIHHDTDSLPELDDLRSELREGFEYLRGLLSRLLSPAAL